MEQRDQRRIVFPDNVAALHQRGAGTAGDWRNDMGEVQLELRLLEAGVVCLSGAGRGLDGG